MIVFLFISVWKLPNGMNDSVAEIYWFDRQSCAGRQPLLLSGGHLALFQWPCRE
jgi:hypothetical protein